MTDPMHAEPTPTSPPTPPESRAHRYDRWVARTGPWLDRLALAFLVAFLIQWLYIHPPAWVTNTLLGIQLLVWAAFAIDYVTRLTLVDDKSDFIRDHKLDLVMVLVPMLRMLRVVLLLRKSLPSISTERIAGSLFAIVAVVVFTAAVLEWNIERQSPTANIQTFGESTSSTPARTSAGGATNDQVQLILERLDALSAEQASLRALLESRRPTVGRVRRGLT